MQTLRSFHESNAKIRKCWVGIMLVGQYDFGCKCGWSRQDVKHVLIMFCSKRREDRRETLEAAQTNHCETLLTTKAGLKGSAKRIMRSDLLGRYSRARDQLYRRQKRKEARTAMTCRSSKYKRTRRIIARRLQQVQGMEQSSTEGFRPQRLISFSTRY